VKYKTSALNIQGITYYFKGDYDNAIIYYTKSLALFTEIGNKRGMGAAMNNIGVVYLDKGDYVNAIEYFMGSLKIEESIGNKEGVANSYNNIGVIYRDQGEDDKAIEFYKKAIEIHNETDDEEGMAHALNNMGVIYLNQDKLELSLDFFKRALPLSEQINDLKGVALILHNIGIIYYDLENYDRATEYLQKSLVLYEELEDKSGVASTYTRFGFVHLQKKEYSKAIIQAKRGLELALDLESELTIRDASEVLHQSYYLMNEPLLAYDMLLLFMQNKDSLNSEENRSEVIRHEFKYMYDKKKEEDSLKNIIVQVEKDAIILAERTKKENGEIQSYYLAGGLLLSLIFGVFIYNRFKVTDRQKIIIQEHKLVLDNSFKELEIKNTEILDSIIYAQRIQSAIMPTDSFVKEHLKDSFILYKPKDVVAGDFYWIEPRNGKLMFAAADCTGHGVPGALVSIVCNNALNRAVREYGLTDPAEILNKVRDIVVAEFEKSDEDVNDGMDIALCSIDGMKLKYAGAFNPLWVVRDGELIVIKADKFSIGKFDFKRDYTGHAMDLKKGDVIYIYSDGYADQFGGEQGKKFKTKTLMTLVQKIVDKPMAEQLSILEQEFNDWKGDLDQIDDICIIGLRV
jgi:serine phosphatase RsbU (regulator of sigma subunit)/tetratricopeptide (TPR) repeat protein